MTGQRRHGIKYWRDVIRMARLTANAASNGRVIITVPHAMVARVRMHVWQLEVEAANEKWAKAVSDVSLPAWNKAVTWQHSQNESDTIQPF
jgi:hypothetical protein